MNLRIKYIFFICLSVSVFDDIPSNYFVVTPFNHALPMRVFSMPGNLKPFLANPAIYFKHLHYRVNCL